MRSENCYLVAQLDDELGKLLHVDDVLRVVRIRVDDLCASRHLERLCADASKEEEEEEWGNCNVDC